MIVCDLIKIPLLDPPWGSLDGLPVIGESTFSGKTRDGAALFIQNRAFC